MTITTRDGYRLMRSLRKIFMNSYKMIMDSVQIEAAQKALDNTIRKMAKDISDK